MDVDEGSADSPFQRLDDEFVATSAAKMAFAAMKSIHRLGLRNGEGRCLMVIGPSRVGKSAVLKQYAKHYPVTRNGRQLLRPVCIVHAPPSNADSALLTATLHTLGDPNPGSGTATLRELRVMNHLRRQKVELLCFDEVNHLIDSDSDKVGYRAGNLIKALLNHGVCPVVLTGVTHAKRVMDTNAELRGRGRRPVIMRPYDWRDDRQRLEFMVFLDRLEKAMGLPAPSELGKSDRAHRIHHFSRGLPGYVVDLLFNALEIREERGNITPCLTDDFLKEAADGLLLREPTTRMNAFREAPPETYEPAPMLDAVKEAPRKRYGRSRLPDDLLD